MCDQLAEQQRDGLSGRQELAMSTLRCRRGLPYEAKSLPSGEEREYHVRVGFQIGNSGWTGTPLPSSQSAMALFDAFRPKWKHSDPDVRVAAAGELDDPMILRRMVIEDGHSFVRHRVFDILREKYPDQEMYADLAKNSDDEEIRRKAIKKLLDESVLEEVAKNDQYRYVRDAAEHRLEELRTNLWGERSVTSGN